MNMVIEGFEFYDCCDTKYIYIFKHYGKLLFFTFLFILYILDCDIKGNGIIVHVCMLANYL